MLRIAVISSLLLAACDVGEIPVGGGDGGNVDGMGSGNGCVNAVTPAAAAHVHSAGAGGGTNAGVACQASGCHGPSPVGPPWTFSGTVYTDNTGTTPKPGATIKLTFGTTTLTAVSDDAGNFYGSQAITFPAKTLATSCPTVSPMVGMLSMGHGNCNNCHNNMTGATTKPIFVMP
jgi:hypothetical protein